MTEPTYVSREEVEALLDQFVAYGVITPEARSAIIVGPTPLVDDPRDESERAFDAAYYPDPPTPEPLGVPGYAGAKGAVPEATLVDRLTAIDAMPNGDEKVDAAFGVLPEVITAIRVADSAYAAGLLDGEGHAKGAVPDVKEPGYWAGDGPPAGPGISEPPEPQGPTTEAGRKLVYIHGSAMLEPVLAIEAEARAAAPPDIDPARLKAWADSVRRLVAVAPISAVIEETGLPASGHSTPPERAAIRKAALAVVDQWLARDLARAIDARVFLRWYFTQPRGRQAKFLREAWAKLDDLMGPLPDRLTAPLDIDALCSFPSSVSDRVCILPIGHPADSPTRFHRFARDG